MTGNSFKRYWKCVFKLLKSKLNIIDLLWSMWIDEIMKESRRIVWRRTTSSHRNVKSTLKYEAFHSKCVENNSSVLCCYWTNQVIYRWNWYTVATASIPPLTLFLFHPILDDFFPSELDFTNFFHPENVWAGNDDAHAPQEDSQGTGIGWDLFTY